jgi:hypothetical protein
VAFTAIPGSVDTKPGNVVPGGGVFVPVRTVTFPIATLSFSANMSPAVVGHLLYQGAATVLVQLRKLVSSQFRPTAVVQSRTFRVPLRVVQRTTTQLDSVPKNVDIAVTETFPYQVDTTNYLGSGDTITAIVAVLTLLSTGAIVTSAWQGAISTAGNIIQVPINGPVLQLGQTYQLAVSFTASTGKRLTILSQLSLVA